MSKNPRYAEAYIYICTTLILRRQVKNPFLEPTSRKQKQHSSGWRQYCVYMCYVNVPLGTVQDSFVCLTCFVNVNCIPSQYYVTNACGVRTRETRSRAHIRRTAYWAKLTQRERPHEYIRVRMTNSHMLCYAMCYAMLCYMLCYAMLHAMDVISTARRVWRTQQDVTVSL